MAIGDDSLSGSSFQFTLRQLFLVLVACSVAFAIFFRWGYAGFFICYFVVCVSALCWGIFHLESPALVVGCVMLFLALFVGIPLSALNDGRTPARRAVCSNNLHNIVLALQQYHNNVGCYPPPYIADASGKPMHSWRVLLLPYLEHKALHSQYRFDEPWDGPNNRKLHNIELKYFQCPSQENPRPNTETNYLAVVGPKTVWPAGNSYVRDADIIDGLSNTILVVEVADSGIHWMEPRDLHVNQMPMAINAPRGQGISSRHPGGAMIGFADGGVRFLRSDLQPEALRAALTSRDKDNDRLGLLRDGR
jgi:prepilin-type processing-associated H-X9-DG protein